MTSQSPRIYIYKITFEEVPYYYYGMHEEKVYDDEYWGSPITNKWCWELYTPKKQILEIFSSREYAAEIERRLIKSVYNTDKWCLNANCSGVFSLDTCSKAGKIGGKKVKELGLGIHGRTKDKMIEDGKKGGKIGSKKLKELGIGIHGRTKDKMSEDGKINGKKTYELGVGVHGLTQEQRIENARKGGKIGGSKGGKKTNSQKWMCIETGYISNPGGLAKYQKARGIDTSKRKRVI